MTLIVRKPGIFSTIQDLGRPGFRSTGINPGGAMDTAAVRILNRALGNEENAAVLEMHYPAPEIEFADDTCFALGGAEFGPHLNGQPITNWKTSFAPKNSQLRFTSKRSGNWSYLAVRGGFTTSEWLGSKSTNLAARTGGVEGRTVAAGDRLECNSGEALTSITVGRSLIPARRGDRTLRFVPSGEYECLTAISEHRLTSEQFAVTNDSSRMGYRLQGPSLTLFHEAEMVTAAAAFGTIQLLPSGQLVILMADHQTSGGYPRLGNLISCDLPLAAQLGPGDPIAFRPVSIDEAESALLAFRRGLDLLSVGCRLTRGQFV